MNNDGSWDFESENKLPQIYTIWTDWSINIILIKFFPISYIMLTDCIVALCSELIKGSWCLVGQDGIY